MQEVIQEIEKAPPTLENEDLIRLGLYRTRRALWGARRRGNGPPAFHLGPRTIRYDREEVIRWMRTRAEKGSRSHDAAGAADGQ